MRNKVLDVAEAAFQARGYHASSLGDIKHFPAHAFGVVDAVSWSWAWSIGHLC